MLGTGPTQQDLTQISVCSDPCVTKHPTQAPWVVLGSVLGLMEAGQPSFCPSFPPDSVSCPFAGTSSARDWRTRGHVAGSVLSV